MENGCEGESTKKPSNNTSSSSSATSSDHGDFDCYICYESAQDPVVTLCGHLFCWPCLYSWLCWLHDHSRPKGCPVCKAPVQTSHAAIPLYGKGKNKTDSSASKSFPGRGTPPPRPRPPPVSRGTPPSPRARPSLVRVSEPTVPIIPYVYHH